jgi:hypothetical protein
MMMSNGIIFKIQPMLRDSLSKLNALDGCQTWLQYRSWIKVLCLRHLFRCHSCLTLHRQTTAYPSCCSGLFLAGPAEVRMHVLYCTESFSISDRFSKAVLETLPGALIAGRRLLFRTIPLQDSPRKKPARKRVHMTHVCLQISWLFTKYLLWQ